MQVNRIDLSDRVAVITGGAQGIGFAIAERLLASGAKVAIWDVNRDVMERAKGELAKKAGEEKLAALKAGGEAGGFSEAKTVSRVKAQGVRPEALGAVMKADTSKLPSYAGVELPGMGYAVYRVNKVSQPANPDAARRKNEQQQIANGLAQLEANAYLEALKKKAKVEILRPPVKPAAGDAEK